MERRHFLITIATAGAGGCLRLSDAQEQSSAARTTATRRRREPTPMNRSPSTTRISSQQTTETAAPTEREPTTGQETTIEQETSTRTETQETSTERERDDENIDEVEFHHGGGGWMATADREIVGVRPTLKLANSITADETVSFTVQNLDTGDQVSLGIDASVSIDTDWISLSMYDADGTLSPQPAVSVRLPEGSPERLDAFLEGDETTFTELERATYRTTIYRDSAELGSTEHEMTIGHRIDYVQVLGEEVIEINFDAGTIPTSGSIRAVTTTDEGRIRALSVGYDEEDHRFFAKFDAEEIPPGNHSTVLQVMKPNTGRPDFTFPVTLEVPENR